MKRILVILLALIIAATSFVSCSQEEPHTHAAAETVEAVDATCTTAGNIKYYKCSCGKLFIDEACTTEIAEADTVVAIDATAHTALTHVEAVAATCGAAGNSEYYKCTACGKYYSDSEGTTEISEEDTVIAATGEHTYSETAAWHRVDGEDVYGYACTVCGDVKEETVTVGMLGPAGGYIFYDVDADNTEDDADGEDDLISTTCGWRYLEAVPTDATKVTSGAMTERVTTITGFYVVNGVDTLISGLTAAVGTGKENTDLILAKDGSIMTTTKGTTASTDYAALKCSNWSVVLTRDEVDYTYDDWFLPSPQELNAYCQTISETGVDNTLMAKKADSRTANDYFLSSQIVLDSTTLKDKSWAVTKKNEAKVASITCGVSGIVIPVRRF